MKHSTFNIEQLTPNGFRRAHLLDVERWVLVVGGFLTFSSLVVRHESV